ncbi:hypothetical protein GCM10023078_46970 [Gibbsiella greigii]
MNDNRKFIIDRENLPPLYPTHRHSSEFWEQLGRTVATFGFLEEVLGKAIFAFTATKNYNSEDIEKACYAWLGKLELALTGELFSLAECYGKAVRENEASTFKDIDLLVDDIKKAAKIRNVLCHASWRAPDQGGKSIPLFVQKKTLEKFETAVDIDFLRQVRKYVVDLACCVIDSVTVMGWQFPGGAGPGEPIIKI